MVERVLVTGASGFIGRRLCHALKSQGRYVVASGRTTSQGPWDEFAIWQIGDTQALRLPRADTVFHLAAKVHALADDDRDAKAYERINVEGTRAVLEAAAGIGVRRFVLFSSVKAMGEGGADCLDESAPCHPETAYGESKLRAESLVLEGGYVPEPVVLRLPMVYGNSDKGNLPRMIRAIARGRFPPLPDSGNKRSMVHADDVVQAAMLAAERPEAIGQVYIVTDGMPYSTREIYTWICDGLGKPIPRWSVPMSFLRALARVGDGVGRLRHRRFAFDSDALDKLVGSACYNSQRIENELGFRARRHLQDSLPGIIRDLEGLHP